jgi:hypothetical protein
MVQGWRYYDIPYLYDHHPQVKYGKEFTQSISGSVKTLTGRKTDGFSLIMFAPEIGLNYHNDFIGSNFYMDSLDFSDGTSFLIQANKRVGKKHLTVHMESDLFAPHFKSSQLYGTLLDSLNEPGTLRNVPIVSKDSVNNMQLKEAIVTASAYYRPKHNPSPFGQSFERSKVKEREELKRDDYKYIQDYLVENYPGFFKSNGAIYSIRSGNIKQTSNETRITKNEPMLYVDGVKMESTSVIKTWSVRDIETLVVLRGNDGALYKSIWGVVLITTRRSGSGIEKQNNKSNGIIINPLGWQKPSRFYSPVYDTPEMYNASNPDYRTTIYWNPSIRTDENGIAKFEFYTSDYKNPCIIRIEGKTSDNRYINKTTYLQIE